MDKLDDRCTDTRDRWSTENHLFGVMRIGRRANSSLLCSFLARSKFATMPTMVSARVRLGDLVGIRGFCCCWKSLRLNAEEAPILFLCMGCGGACHFEEWSKMDEKYSVMLPRPAFAESIPTHWSCWNGEHTDRSVCT